MKRAPDVDKAAIERTPLPVLATCLSRWGNMHWKKVGTDVSSIPPSMTPCARGPEIVVARRNGGSWELGAVETHGCEETETKQAD